MSAEQQIREAAENPAATIVPELPSDKLCAMPVHELMALQLPERRRALPWLVEGGLVMVYGPRGVGKTYFTLGLAAALVSGQDFLRWPVTEPMGVLLVDGEMALTELRERLASLLPGILSAPLEVISHEVVFEKTEADINLGRDEWQDAISDYVERHPDIRVIIIDNLACLLPTIREDKRDDWANYVMPFLIALRRRGVAVVLIHHAGKGGDQRGTSSREDALNTVIRLDRVPDHDSTQGAQFIVRFTKSRSAYGDDVADFEARLEQDETGLPIWTCKAIEESNEERLLRLVRDGIETVSEAAEELDLTRGTVSKLKKKLIGKGLLVAGTALVLADAGREFP